MPQAKLWVQQRRSTGVFMADFTYARNPTVTASAFEVQTQRNSGVVHAANLAACAVHGRIGHTQHLAGKNRVRLKPAHYLPHIHVLLAQEFHHFSWRRPGTVVAYPTPRDVLCLLSREEHSSVGRLPPEVNRRSEERALGATR